MKVFEDVPIQVVGKVPYNVNGTCIFHINATEDDWIKKQKDGRWWGHMNTSSRKGLTGLRKVGRCAGSWMCPHDNCPLFTGPNGKRNRSSFSPFGAHQLCLHCNQFGIQESCCGLKIAEFNTIKESLEVFYTGQHTCTLREAGEDDATILQKRAMVLEEVKKNPDVGPEKIYSQRVEYHLRRGENEEAQHAAKLLRDKRSVQRIRAEYLKETAPITRNSWMALDTAIENLNKDDKFRVYRYNNREKSGEASYVFKSSRIMAQMAIEMDVNDPTFDPCFEEENGTVYIDAMHNRVNNMKTLTMWLYYTKLRRVFLLATMEAEREDTRSLTLFLTIFNEMLQEVKGDNTYQFNPRRFMVDEAGCNKNAIENVFGAGKMGAKKTVGCQWHFLNCCKARSSQVAEENRASFKYTCKRLTQAVTQEEIDNCSASLLDICQRSGLLNWYKWWEVRRYHIIPKYRGFNLSGVSLAEIGHSKMRNWNKTPMRLVDSFYKDTCKIMKQDMAYKDVNKAQDVRCQFGKGPALVKAVQKDLEGQKKRALQYATALNSGILDDSEEDEDPSYFLPSKSAKHKAPKVFDQKNPTEESPKSIRARGRGRGRGAAPNRAGKKKEVGQNKKAQEEEDDRADRTSLKDVNTEVEKEFLGTTAPSVVLPRPKVKVCCSCSKSLAREQLPQAPWNMYFLMKCFRKRREYEDGAWTGQYIMAKERSNAYFCFRDMACLQKMDGAVTRAQLYMCNADLHALTLDQVAVLKQRGYWNAIMRNRQRLIDDN